MVTYSQLVRPDRYGTAPELGIACGVNALEVFGARIWVECGAEAARALSTPPYTSTDTANHSNWFTYLN